MQSIRLFVGKENQSNITGPFIRKWKMIGKTIKVYDKFGKRDE